MNLQENKMFLNNYFYEFDENERDYGIIFDVLYEINENELSTEQKNFIKNNNLNIDLYTEHTIKFLNENKENLSVSNIIENLLINKLYFD